MVGVLNSSPLHQPSHGLNGLGRARTSGLAMPSPSRDGKAIPVLKEVTTHHQACMGRREQGEKDTDPETREHRSWAHFPLVSYPCIKRWGGVVFLALWTLHANPVPPPEEQINKIAGWHARGRRGSSQTEGWLLTGTNEGAYGPKGTLAIVWLLCRPPSAGGHRPPLRTATPAEHRGACGPPE